MIGHSWGGHLLLHLLAVTPTRVGAVGVRHDPQSSAVSAGQLRFSIRNSPPTSGAVHPAVSPRVAVSVAVNSLDVERFHLASWWRTSSCAGWLTPGGPSPWSRSSSSRRQPASPAPGWRPRHPGRGSRTRPAGAPDPAAFTDPPLLPKEGAMRPAAHRPSRARSTTGVGSRAPAAWSTRAPRTSCPARLGRRTAAGGVGHSLVGAVELRAECLHLKRWRLGVTPALESSLGQEHLRR